MQIVEAVLIIVAIRELREYRKDRLRNDNSRKEAADGKT